MRRRSNLARVMATMHIRSRHSITDLTTCSHQRVQSPIDALWPTYDCSDSDGLPTHFAVHVLGAARLAATSGQGFEMDPASESLPGGRNHRGSAAQQNAVAVGEHAAASATDCAAAAGAATRVREPRAAVVRPVGEPTADVETSLAHCAARHTPALAP